MTVPARQEVCLRPSSRMPHHLPAHFYVLRDGHRGRAGLPASVRMCRRVPPLIQPFILPLSSLIRRPWCRRSPFRFELTKVQVPAIRERTVSMLRNVSDELAQAVADGLGISLPQPKPRVIKPRRAEVTTSPALSLTLTTRKSSVPRRRCSMRAVSRRTGDVRAGFSAHPRRS